MPYLDFTEIRDMYRFSKIGNVSLDFINKPENLFADKPINEFKCAVVTLHTVLVKKEHMRLIRHDHEFKVHVSFGPQLLHKVGRLLEGHTSIIVTVDKEHW